MRGTEPPVIVPTGNERMTQSNSVMSDPQLSFHH